MQKKKRTAKCTSFIVEGNVYGYMKGLYTATGEMFNERPVYIHEDSICRVHEDVGRRQWVVNRWYRNRWTPTEYATTIGDEYPWLSTWNDGVVLKPIYTGGGEASGIVQCASTSEGSCWLVEEVEDTKYIMLKSALSEQYLHVPAQATEKRSNAIVNNLCTEVVQWDSTSDGSQWEVVNLSLHPHSKLIE